MRLGWLQILLLLPWRWRRRRLPLAAAERVGVSRGSAGCENNFSNDPSESGSPDLISSSSIGLLDRFLQSALREIQTPDRRRSVR